MHWLVEISRFGEGVSQRSFRIEANDWRGALQQVLQSLGDERPLSGFFMDVLENGYRATDPKRRIRYLVRRAPDQDAPAPAASVRSQGPPPELSADQSVVPHRVIRSREHDPTPDRPICYREYAYAVQEGMGPELAEALIRERFQNIARELEARPAGKLVQLAVFDHVFADRPIRRPLATLTWKDWIGAPVVQSGAQPVSIRVWPERPLEQASMPPPVVEPEPMSIPLTQRKSSPPQTPQPMPPQASKPSRSVRREGDDLIADLFETMHDLHFLRDVISGSDFVLELVNQTLPSEVVMVHLFDIDSRNFVVVRASGPKSQALLLHKSPDPDELFDAARRNGGTLQVAGAESDPGYRSSRWARLEARPKTALVGAVEHGGRTLGMIEVLNPEGGGAFFKTEVAALEYICAQFGEFLSHRPIVTDPEVVLSEN
jgi:hypothetical protein